MRMVLVVAMVLLVMVLVVVLVVLVVLVVVLVILVGFCFEERPWARTDMSGKLRGSELQQFKASKDLLGSAVRPKTFQLF